MRIIIIGAGIGGLCAAIGLQRTGAEVTLVERAQQLAPVGSGLSIFGNGWRALDVLGVGDPLRSISAPAGALRAGQRRPDGRWLSTIPPDAIEQLRVIERPALHEGLVRALEPGTVHLGVTVDRVDADGTVAWTDTDGRSSQLRADLVVGADGIHSTVRQTVFGVDGVRYAGSVAWRGITDRSVDLLGAAGETWGRRRRFGMAPLAGGKVYWFTALTGSQAELEKIGFDEMAGLFNAWHAPIPELLTATEPAGVIRSPILELGTVPASFHRGRVVLLGDAAHAMTPDLGQGGAQAMEDAATMVALLEAPRVDLDTALRRYDELRRPRTTRIARQARSIDALGRTRQVRLRDLALRLTPAAAVGRRLRAVQSWTPPS